MLLMKELDKASTIELRRFYVRRAYRILPAAIVFMVVVFVMFWQELRWYHMAAPALYLVNYDFAHPWFLGHLWSLSVQEQFYFLWPGVLKRWYRHRVRIAIGAIAVAPLFRILGHLLRLHGRGDEAFPAVADILAIGCLLALFWKRVPTVRAWCAALMLVPVVLVPVYMGVLKFHVTAVLLLALWPVIAFFDCGIALVCSADAVSHSEFRAGGLVRKAELQPLFGAAVVYVWRASETLVFPDLGGRGGGSIVLSVGTADDPVAGAGARTAERSGDGGGRVSWVVCVVAEVDQPCLRHGLFLAQTRQ